VVGVLFFGVCGLVILLIPLVDRGPTNRVILNALAAVAVGFFIVMTTWGWFSRPDDALLRIVLGALLTTIVLFLLVSVTEPTSGARKVVYGALTLAVSVLLAAACWQVVA
jgi:quinol-cytochrome oxidoreductase complex cytochrome b subunit